MELLAYLRDNDMAMVKVLQSRRLQCAVKFRGLRESSTADESTHGITSTPMRPTLSIVVDRGELDTRFSERVVDEVIYDRRWCYPHNIMLIETYLPPRLSDGPKRLSGPQRWP